MSIQSISSLTITSTPHLVQQSAAVVMSRESDEKDSPATIIKAEKSIARYLGSKEAEWTELVSKEGPLNLLDLPLDILQTILKDVTHTNDLAALALTHSALYDLVIPHIYSRFDIVWPEANPTNESRAGVDALTYGLATLVMGHDVYGEVYDCHETRPGNSSEGNDRHTHGASPRKRLRPIRRGNCYAQFTKKFSLGNGPEDWVREYSISKEGGKMLGTLVAVAIGRMKNLEAFTWDMPTGVLRDVWLALASHATRNEDQKCKLERVWVRWHANSEHPLPSTAMRGMIPVHDDLPTVLNGTIAPIFMVPPYPRVEHPTFSVLPSLRSLSVLEVDEVSYVEEMGVLIERSLDRLEELRIGVALHAQHDPWTRPQEEKDFTSPLMRSSTPNLRPGGLLGIVVGRFFSSVPTSSPSTLPNSNVKTQTLYKEDQPSSGLDHLRNSMASHTIEDTTRGDSYSQQADEVDCSRSLPINKRQSRKRLCLKTLELERVYLSTHVLTQAIDCSKLRSLTLLGCRNHDQLWRALRRKYTPASRRRSYSTALAATPFSSMLSPRSVSGPSLAHASSAEYELKITNLHTDTVSSNLLSFIKDALAPETLESLFLQQNTNYKTTVTIDQIFKSVIRPHRSSLKKLLVDSDLRLQNPASAILHWKNWAFTKDIITCITSGRMQLRELGMCINFKEWHSFLQRLPNASSLRSLHISHIADHVHGRVDCRDTAQQILNVVALRPEIELCYVGIQAKCFEIFELPANRGYSPSPRRRSTIDTPVLVNITNDGDDEDDDENDEDGDLDDDASDDADDDGDNSDSVDNDDDDNEALDDDDDDDDGDMRGSRGQKAPVFRLREILFYDDKVSIFKARHGKL